MGRFPTSIYYKHTCRGLFCVYTGCEVFETFILVLPLYCCANKNLQCHDEERCQLKKNGIICGQTMDDSLLVVDLSHLELTWWRDWNFPGQYPKCARKIAFSLEYFPQWEASCLGNAQHQQKTLLLSGCGCKPYWKFTQKSLESWVHVGPGPRLVLDGAQWLKATKCPTGLPLIHTTHSFLNAVIRAQCCSADWTPALCSLQVSVRNYSQAVKSNTVSLLFDKQEETSVSKRSLFFYIFCLECFVLINIASHY